MVGPQTTRNGVVAIDPHSTRSGIAWDHSVAWTNDDISRFGMMPSCGGTQKHRERGSLVAIFAHLSTASRIIPTAPGKAASSGKE
jgi:hypothetical protein